MINRTGKKKSIFVFCNLWGFFIVKYWIIFCQFKSVNSSSVMIQQSCILLYSYIQVLKDEIVAEN